MHIELVRYAYHPDCTLGRLTLRNEQFHTIERPWRRNRKNESCVPDGVYDLVPHTRPDGTRTWALVAPTNHVYYRPEDVPEGETGRTWILIHSANWVSQVVGCIAPGKTHTIMRNPETGRPENAVGHSGDAMDAIRDILEPGTEGHTLRIRNHPGAHLFE